jgi:hypothetical protein
MEKHIQQLQQDKCFQTSPLLVAYKIDNNDLSSEHTLM